MDMKQLIQSNPLLFNRKLHWMFVDLKNRMIKVLVWFFWDFSGLRLIWSKIVPPISGKDELKRPPSTFLIWLIGIYLGVFTLSSSIYEYKKSLIDNRMNFLINEIADSPDNKYAFNRLADIQKVTVPLTGC